VTRRVGVGVLAAVVVPFAAVACGIGWLYLLRSSHLLAFGPPVKGALALQQLALADGQPLARVLVAWALAGLAAGALLRALAGRAGVQLLPVFAVGSAVWLVVAGAASDALANNARVVDQLGAQLSSGQLPVALAAVVCAALAGLLAAASVVRLPVPE
jgi:hypothetical protein